MVLLVLSLRLLTSQMAGVVAPSWGGRGICVQATGGQLAVAKPSTASFSFPPSPIQAALIALSRLSPGSHRAAALGLGLNSVLITGS